MVNLIRTHIKLIIVFVFICKFLTIDYMLIYSIDEDIFVERMFNLIEN